MQTCLFDMHHYLHNISKLIKDKNEESFELYFCDAVLNLMMEQLLDPVWDPWGVLL